MRRAAIVSPLRTAVGRFGGMFKNLPAEDLASHVISAVWNAPGWMRPKSMTFFLATVIPVGKIRPWVDLRR